MRLFFRSLLTFHPTVLLVIILFQFLLGQYTEIFLDLSIIISKNTTLVLRDVINVHKSIGKSLLYGGILLLSLKIWYYISKTPRPTFSSLNMLAIFSIKHHWWIYALVLFPLQYCNTVLAGHVAILLDIPQTQVFFTHCQ